MIPLNFLNDNSPLLLYSNTQRSLSNVEKQKLKVITTFSGIGMQERGLENTNLFDLDVLHTCEIDIWAIISYAAIHNNLTPEMVDTYDYPSREEMAEELSAMNIGYNFKNKKEYNWKKKVNSKKDTLLQKTWLACKLNKNVGDITLVEKFPYCDLFTFSFPCTDLSNAGLKKGMIKGKTRSGLVYEVLRILENEEPENRPRFMLMENVAALVNKRNLPSYQEINKKFKKIGYDVRFKVLEGSLAGVPQHRERVFALYYKENIDGFTFPLNFDCNMTLQDIMHEEVDEKYYVKHPYSESYIQEVQQDETIDEDDFEIIHNPENYEIIRNIKCRKIK